MRRGFSLAETMLVLIVIGASLTIALPRVGGILDAVAADAAARDVTSAIAVTRAAAIAQGVRARLLISLDSLRLDRMGPTGWEPYLRWPGPSDRGVGLRVSNPELIFGPTGMGWGPSNTTVTLRRGSHIETVTTSRLGRVKRW